jgi:hypothetical protein
MQKLMLMPAAVLVIWSLLVLIWMARKRFAHAAQAGLNVAQTPAGARGLDLEGRFPPEVMWASHNYTHLMEQPTLFYAVVGILALAGAGWADIALGWAYVALRIAHSVWQINVNTVPTRLRLFRISTFVLMALAVKSLIATLF